LQLLWLSVALWASLSSAQDFVCPSEGLHPDPENCQAFYQCAAFRPPIWNLCPSTTLFDHLLKICNYPHQVECGDRPNPMPSTTTVSTVSTEPPPVRCSDRYLAMHGTSYN
jgi:hypothetical protein